MVITDQLGNQFELSRPPQRVISVVPSLTELLFDLGSGHKVVGKTTFCIHPQKELAGLKSVGGTKKLQIEKILDLEPDIVLANKEENLKEQIEEISKHIPVLVTDIESIPQAYEAIHLIGKVLSAEQNSENLISDIKSEFQKVELKQTVRAAYFIWREPYMVVGGDTFISQMMNEAGLENVFKAESRYPEKTITDINNADPEVFLWSSEPFPFSEKYLPQIIEHFPNKKHLLVDGELFSWYGSRMKYAPAYFKRLQAQLALG